jgi:ferredoxin
MSYRIVIDGLACSGFCDCADLALDIFELGSHGKALLRVGTSSNPAVLDAVSACPMDAISVENDAA